jgi:hypothetical protein
MRSCGQPTYSDESDHAEWGHRHRRAELRARLAAERAELLCSLLGMDVGALEGRPLQGTASAADLLSAVASREDAFVAVLTQPLDKSQPDVNAQTDVDRLPTGFDESLARCVGARSRFLDAFARVPDDVLFGEPADSEYRLSPLTMATQCHWSDASLSLRASSWSREQGMGASVGPSSLVRAAVRAARKDLLTTVALVPQEVRELALFEGGRTLSQVFRLIVELESTFLGHLAGAGFAPAAVAIEPTDAGNDTWEGTWSDLHSTHAALLRVLDALDPAAYGAAIGQDDDAESVYMWARGCLLHDRLYGAHIRAVLELDWPERLLR